MKLPWYLKFEGSEPISGGLRFNVRVPWYGWPALVWAVLRAATVFCDDCGYEEDGCVCGGDT